MSGSPTDDGSELDRLFSRTRRRNAWDSPSSSSHSGASAGSDFLGKPAGAPGEPRSGKAASPETGHAPGVPRAAAPPNPLELMESILAQVRARFPAPRGAGLERMVQMLSDKVQQWQAAEADGVAPSDEQRQAIRELIEAVADVTDALGLGERAAGRAGGR